MSGTHKDDLIAGGIDPRGGTRYYGRRKALGPGTSLEVGTKLTVKRIVPVGNGEARVELETDDGRTVHATVASRDSLGSRLESGGS